MKKYLVLLFTTLMVPSLSFADGSDAAKINLVKKLYKTDKHGYENGEPYSKYASPEFKNIIKQAYRIIDGIERRTGDYCGMAEHFDQGFGNGDSKISKLKITPLSGNLVQVTFSDGSLKNNLKYDISCTSNRCVINDIINDGRSIRKQYQKIISSKSCD
ncbi:TPA: hypothetical protein ACFP3X_000809 [Neisseria subflava]|jgi:hypothetical protein|nr:hypothetical protein [Neisseria meningitidis]